PEGRERPHHGRSVRGDQGAARGVLPRRMPEPGRGDRGGAGDPVGEVRRGGRGSPDRRAALRTAPADVVDRLFRRESGRAVASLARVFGDIDAAEEAVQEAFAVALERWPAHGVPDNPAAWITTTARNKAIDRLRRERRFEQKRAELERQARLESESETDTRGAGPIGMIPDERLSLMFTCCHPALSVEAQVALTL